MLHLRPDLVHMDKAANFVPLSAKMEGEYELLSPEGKVGFGWQTQDLNPAGACGNAAAADAKSGAALLEFYANRFIQLMWEIDRFPLTSLKTR
jgi:creatinine amidohydrolase